MKRPTILIFFIGGNDMLASARAPAAEYKWVGAPISSLGNGESLLDGYLSLAAP